jgi:hypothetical protein
MILSYGQNTAANLVTGQRQILIILQGDKAFQIRDNIALTSLNNILISASRAHRNAWHI